MLGLLDLGVAHASASKAVILSSKNDEQGIRTCLHTALAFSLGVCIAIIIVGAVAIPLIDWKSLLDLSSIDNTEASHALLWLLGYICINLLGNPLNAWLRAIDRTATGIFLLANRRLIDIAVTIAALFSGCNIVELAIWMFISQTIFLATLVLYTSIQSPWPMLGLKSASTKELRSVIKPATAHIGITIGQTATLQGGIQILNQFAPEAIVIAYSMSRTLMRLILQIGVVCSQALRPELSRLIGLGEHIKATLLTKRITALAVITAIFTYSLLIVFGPWIIQLWSQRQIEADHWSLALIGAHALMNVSWYVPAAYQMAENLHAPIAKVYFSTSLLAIGLWLLFPSSLNPIEWAALVLLIPELSTTMLLIKLSRNRKRVNT